MIILHLFVLDVKQPLLTSSVLTSVCHQVKSFHLFLYINKINNCIRSYLHSNRNYNISKPIHPQFTTCFDPYSLPEPFMKFLTVNRTGPLWHPACSTYTSSSPQSPFIPTPSVQNIHPSSI